MCNGVRNQGTARRLSVRWGLVLAAVVLLTGPVAAQQVPRGFVDAVFRDDEGEHKYVVFVPRGYTPEKKWPVILFLHGGGERGSDGRRQTTVGLGPFVQKRAETFPFLVVFPQNEDVEGRILTGWNFDSPNGRRALKILEEVERKYNVDPKRRILTGWSMGGYGTWSIGAAMPDHWAAVVPIAGGGDPENAKELKDTPVWAFHAARDRAVLPTESREMVEALRQAGGNPRYDEIPDQDHDVWRVVYDSDRLFAWMQDPKSDGASAEPFVVQTDKQQPGAESGDNEPFVPALEIPQAGYVRLGNDALKTFSYALPELVPSDLMSGRIPDIHDSTTAEGRYFSVVFSNIGYRGRVSKAHIAAYKTDRLNIQLGLEDVTLTIGSTYVSGSGRSASAGPIDISIGHRSPVWLSVALEPFVENRRLRLRYVTARFDIPRDNYSVGYPAGVSTQGLGMTRERVTSGLVNGLYSSRGRIEREVIAIVPRLIGRLEEKLDVAEVSNFVGAFWPLPVYRPRARVWPEQVATDANGVSLVFGVTAAAIDSDSAPQRPATVPPLGLQAGDVGGGKALEFGLSLDVLEPLTELLVESGKARIHVADLPDQTFALFADRQTLEGIVPELKRYPPEMEIRSELILKEPLSVDGEEAEQSGTSDAATDRQPEENATDLDPADETGDDVRATDSKTALRLNASRLTISLAINPEPNQDQWTPLADFDFELSQRIHAALSHPTFGRPTLRVDWAGTPQIIARGRFAEGYTPQDDAIDADRLQALFERAWTAYMHSATLAEHEVPDVEFGSTRLRLANVGWSQPNLSLRFEAPALRLSNLAEVPLVYETKSPTSAWGGPYTLEPGESHTYKLPYALLFRRRIDSRYRTFTLPVGSHSEFRSPRAGGPPQLFQARTAAIRPTSGKATVSP